MEALKKKKNVSVDHYPKFDKLNGSHPFKKVVPDGFVDYPARIRKDGTLRYFNFELARQMGLIPKDHPNEMNANLEKAILNTFGIIIINEYDQMNNIQFPKKEIKEGTYMATKYLQLQHEDKKGRTSGDGRSVWNGHVKHRGKSWDVSSGGTGATRLSPATSQFNKFFQSGDPSISYGCGYAELDEGLATALMSEVFQKNGIETERTLAVIQYEKNFAVNVRAQRNLLRPSHFFNHLKQNNLESLTSLLDYYIDKEKENDSWRECPDSSAKYDFFMDKFCETFAKMAAIFESEYIFCWLDWDGDNILMNGGIIDYGSVRQFGLFHCEYRYDDVSRFSTTILEQKEKAKYTVQTFLQAVDYVKTGKKKKISEFKKNKVLDRFEDTFEMEKNRRLLNKVGFNHEQVSFLLDKNIKLVRDFKRVFYYFERAKSKKGRVKVSDGITWDAIFCMRDLLRELPQVYLSRMEDLEDTEFIEILRSSYAISEDLEITAYRKKMIQQFQKAYWKLVKKVSSHFDEDVTKVLLQICMKSSTHNKMERLTGDAATHIVDVIMQQKKMSLEGLYQLIEEFSDFQNLGPKSKSNKKEDITKKNKNLLREFFEIVKEHREGL